MEKVEKKLEERGFRAAGGRWEKFSEDGLWRLSVEKTAEGVANPTLSLEIREENGRGPADALRNFQQAYTLLASDLLSLSNSGLEVSDNRTLVSRVKAATCCGCLSYDACHQESCDEEDDGGIPWEDLHHAPCEEYLSRLRHAESCEEFLESIKKPFKGSGGGDGGGKAEARSVMKMKGRIKKGMKSNYKEGVGGECEGVEGECEAGGTGKEPRASSVLGGGEPNGGVPGGGAGTPEVSPSLKQLEEVRGKIERLVQGLVSREEEGNPRPGDLRYDPYDPDEWADGSWAIRKQIEELREKESDLEHSMGRDDEKREEREGGKKE